MNLLPVQKNAVIESANIKIERGFILTAHLVLSYHDGHQSFGGYSLYLNATSKNHADSMKINFAGRFIARVMEIAGVDQWSDLKGKTVRVIAEHSKCHEIGHIIKDDWFNPSKEFEAMKPSQENA